MIEFVYFDLGNVLWTFDENQASENLARLLDVSVDRARAAQYDSGLQDRFEHGQVSPEGFAEQLCRSLEVAYQESQTQAILDAISDMFTPIEAMVDVIADVKAGGTRVGILSNTCHAHWNWVQRKQHAVMRGPFDATVLSHEVSSMKPEDQIYRAAELVASVPSDRILFLDDKAENVTAAKLRGWKAERCLHSDDVVRALTDHGVPW